MICDGGRINCPWHIREDICYVSEQSWGIVKIVAAKKGKKGIRSFNEKPLKQLSSNKKV